MAHDHNVLSGILGVLDLGSSIAEQDNLLESARVETSAFADVLRDKVDLVPGTKGSGKSALFRIFVDFLPQHLLEERKVVVAHGVQKHGDNVFHAFNEQFKHLCEDDFVSFWCIYLTSLAHEQFIKGEMYAPYLKGAKDEIERFRAACSAAQIPEIKAKKSLREILNWSLHVLQKWAPRLRYKLPDNGGDFELDLFGKPIEEASNKKGTSTPDVPRYVRDVKNTLEDVLKATGLSIWLMIDRLDEVFPRRSSLETTALRGLLRAMRLFTTEMIRIKVFLRDDMLEQVVLGESGFTALTHITARKTDTLRWSENQIVMMLVKRIFTDTGMAEYFQIEKEKLEESQEYRLECFYKVFPGKVHTGPRQSRTHRWIYNHTMDGRGVVTPRDIIDLVSKAKQNQLDEFLQSPTGKSANVIGSRALQYGLDELSKRKRETYLQAEFPHLWPQIEKFENGKTEYESTKLKKVLGKHWESIANDLVAIGLLKKRASNDNTTYWIPYVWRKGLNLTQGQA